MKSFYPTAKRNTFEKEYEAADALVQISGMLVDAAQILRDCHKASLWSPFSRRAYITLGGE